MARTLAQTAPLSLYSGGGILIKSALIVGDVVMWLWAFGLFIRFTLDASIYGFAQCVESIWNVLALLFFISECARMGLVLRYEQGSVDDVVKEVSKGSVDRFVDMGDLHRTFWWSLIFANTSLFFGLPLLFKHTQHNRRLSRIWQTLYVARRSLGAMLFAFFVLLLGCVFTMWFVMASSSPRWTDLTHAWLETLSMVSGHYSFDSLEGDNLVFALVFSVVVLCIFHFVLFNMFVAIISDAYFEVSAIGITGNKQRFWRDVLTAPLKLLFRGFYDSWLKKDVPGKPKYA